MQQRLVIDIQAAHAAMPDHVGPALGLLVAKGDVPLEFVGQVLKASHVSLYRWFKEGDAKVRATNMVRMQRLRWVLERAIANGVLPSGDFTGEIDELIELWGESKGAV